MDIKVLNLDKNKLLQFNNMSVKDKDKFLTQSLYPGLGLRVIVQDYQLTDDINDKIDKLENSFVEISWLAYEFKKPSEQDCIGLYSNKRICVKKSYTFSPLK